MSYNPIPTRVWSRVQNQCTNTNSGGNTNDLVYIPLTNQYVTPLQAMKYSRMISKGNVLQYKKNSSNLTKTQKYSQISKGLGPGRRKCYATQSETYTNPNTSSLLRVNYTNIPYPNQIVGSPNNPSGPYQVNVPNPFDCSTNVLQDGGNLVCNAYTQPCSGIITETTTSQQCFPTYCSDVPGQIMNLCWNSGIQTWYPRQRYIMTNSLNKWPQGYKGFQSALTPAAPFLKLVLYLTNVSVTLSWSVINNVCIPISSYNIYENSALIQTVPYPISSITLPIVNGTTYSFYITAISYNISSLPSNVIIV